MSFLKGLFHKKDGSGQTTFFGNLVNKVTGLVGVGDIIHDKAPDASYYTSQLATPMLPSASSTTVLDSSSGSSPGWLASVGDIVSSITHPSVTVSAQESQFNFMKVGLIGIGILILVSLFKNHH